MTQNKRTNLEVIFKALIIGIIVYLGMFAFYLEESSYSSVARPDGISNAYNNLSANLNDINATVGSIRENVFALSENKGIIEKAITSIEGFTSTIKLMGQLFTFGFNSLMVSLGNALPIPAWLSLLLFLMITILIVFAMLKAISGRENI